MPSFDANCKHKGLGGIPLLQSTKSSSGLEKYLTLGAIEDWELDKLTIAHGIPTSVPLQNNFHS